MQYEITPKLGSTDQVGLRLKCDNRTQAETIRLALRQEGLKLSILMESTHSEFAYFIYVTATQSYLEQILPQIITQLSSNTPQSTTNQGQSVGKTPLIFQSWQSQFRQAVKKLNNDSPRPSFATQEINPSRLSKEISAGRTIDIEDKLLKQINQNDHSALRTLIALYAQTEQYEQIVELTKAKRSEVLALPVSGRLVEQLVTAHIQYSQQAKTPALLQTAQTIAMSFLPELERLHQANNVRKLLHQALNPQESPPKSTGLTLNEQLAELLEIEPGERILRLKSLNHEYPKATNVLLALAESYTAIGNYSEALNIYESIPSKTEKIQFIYASLLLKNERFQNVLGLLPESINELSPALSGLRGVALYHTGNQASALEFLNKAWQEGENNVQILFPLARLSTESEQFEQAGRIYQILQETAQEQLTIEDYANMAKVANCWGFGDLSDRQIVEYYEECVQIAATKLIKFPKAQELLQERLALWESLGEIEGLLNAYADWLDWLTRQGQIEQIEQVFAKIRTLTIQNHINRQQHFELIESLEPYIYELTQLRDSLANDYFAVALAEIDNSIRLGEAEAPFFEDLKRSLFYLDKDLLQELINYRLEQRTEAQNLNIKLSQKNNTVTDAIFLSSIRLALVGGHKTTRRAIIHELQENYALKDVVEIFPSSEVYINRNTVQEKIQHCNLIAVITGYIGHDLTRIIYDLKQNNALAGEVLLLSCRGKSGVIRSIIDWVRLSEAKVRN